MSGNYYVRKMYHDNFIISSKIIDTKHQMLWNKESRYNTLPL